MYPLLLVISVALAGPADAPWMLPVTLAPAGVTRVALPPEIAATTDADLATRMKLVAVTGETAAFTLVASGAESSPDDEYLRVTPISPGVWEVEAAERPITQLRLVIEDLGSVGPVEARVGEADSAIVFDQYIDGIDAENSFVPVPRGRGPFRITVKPFGDHSVHLGAAYGFRHAHDYVPPHIDEIVLDPPTITEEGKARYAIRLPGRRRVHAITVVASEDLYSREVTVLSPDPDGAPQYVTSSAIRRLALLGARIDRNTVSGMDFVGDRFILDIAMDQGRVLNASQILVESSAIDLLTRDPGAEAYTLFVGGAPVPAGTDLSLARDELFHLAGERLVAGSLQPNPEFVPVADREGVADAGSLLNMARFHWERALTAPAGWARVIFDNHVLAAARFDMADVRIVDKEGRQIPFVLQRTGREIPWKTGEVDRNERDGVTELRLSLGEINAPVETVTLHTARNMFVRTVTILRDRGAITEPVRRVTWAGGEQGNTVAIAVNQHLGKALLVTIDNGDNPPLPVDDVTVTAPEWELRVRLPAEGARLVYGAASENAPTYDLSQLRGDVFDGPVNEAVLGDPASLGGPVANGTDKLAVTIALGVLAVGLLGMLVRVLRGASEAA